MLLAAATAAGPSKLSNTVWLGSGCQLCLALCRVERNLGQKLILSPAAAERCCQAMQLMQAVCSCVQGEVQPEAAAHVAGKLFAMGCYEVSMGDTIGVGTPASVAAMFQVRARG